MRRLTLALKIAVSVALLAYILSRVPFTDIAGVLAAARAAWVALGLALSALMIYAGARQMKAVTDPQGLGLSVGRHATISLQTSFYNLFLPGSLSAGAVRWYKFAREEGKPAEALGSLAFHRVLETIVVAALGLAFWLPGRPPETDPIVTLGLTAVLVALLGLYVVLFRERPQAWLRRFLPARVEKWSAALSCYGALSRGALGRLVALALVKHLLGVLVLVSFARAVGIDLGVAQAGWIRSFTMIALMLPVSFAGLGLREGAMVVMLQPFGVAASPAVALSFLLLGRDVLNGVAGGLLEMRDWFRRRRAPRAPEGPLRVCLVCVEFFGLGKAGGFGKATRIIGRELAARGVDVTAVVPRRGAAKPVQTIDGITVRTFPKWAPWSCLAALRAADADVYHTQEPSFGTWLARVAAPDRTHVVTLRDPRDDVDWKIERRFPSVNELQVRLNRLYEDNRLVRRAIRKADAVFCAAPHLEAKARRIYGVAATFLPTPVAIPPAPSKAAEPTICYVGRWDRRKRPEVFFELARTRPDVRCIAIGRSRDAAWEAELRARYADLPNLELVGFVDQFASNKLEEVLGASWVYVNTAAREGLPNAFLEAAAHGCAILSGVNPDDFATDFGEQVDDDDFAAGLARLLENGAWRAKGDAARAFVRDTFGADAAIARHLAAYDAVRGGRSSVTADSAAVS